MLSTIDLLVKIPRFVKREKNVFRTSSNWSEIFSGRRSIVRILPLQLAFPVSIYWLIKQSKSAFTSFVSFFISHSRKVSPRGTYSYKQFSWRNLQFMRSKLECLSLGESSTLVQCLLVSVRGHTLENSNLVSYFLAVKYETRLDVSFKDKTL